jgi:hypothetical protein
MWQESGRQGFPIRKTNPVVILGVAQPHKDILMERGCQDLLTPIFFSHVQGYDEIKRGMQTVIFRIRSEYPGALPARPALVNKATTEDVGLKGSWDMMKTHFPFPKYGNQQGEKETLPRRAFKVVV